MEYIYFLGLLVPIGMVVWLMLYDVKNSVSQYLNLLIVIIANFGYLFLNLSRTLEEALFSQIIIYVGGVFLPLFYFFLILEICHLELSRFIRAILLLIQWTIYGFVCTIGRNELLYKSAEMYRNNGVVVLEKSYGPLHGLAIGSMYFYLLCSLGVVIYTNVKKKAVDGKKGMVMLWIMTIAIGVNAVERAFNLDCQIVPFAYDLLMLASLIPIYDSNIYTVYENKNIIDEQLKHVAFLTFDKNKRYKGCNAYMETIFPELSFYRLGQVIENCSQDLKKIINEIFHLEKIYKKHSKEGHIHLPIKSILKDDRYYDGMIHILTNPFGKLKGYTIELRDSTEHYKALELRERYNDELSREVAEKTRRIETIQEKIILGMAQMVESRDLSTGGHIKRTSDVVRIFANKLLDANLGLDAKFLDLVMRSAPMHDLGKIGVDDAVLRKQGRYTAEEYDKMKKHSEIGYIMVGEILSDVEEADFVRVAENVAHYHHEKVDGTGYPSGLKGEEIPIEARIMALADVFDALVSKRCYKDAFSFEKAYEIIEKDAGSHFDKRLAHIFLSCKEDLEAYYRNSKM